MLRRAVCGILLILLFIVMFLSAINIKPAKAEWTGTVYIRADGSIDPPDAPITTYDNITYILTSNITSSADGIVVERDNIILDGDGAGYIVQGMYVVDSKGISLSWKTNITIKNTNIKRFHYGIYLHHSSFNIIYGSNIVNNDKGIYFWHSSKNAIYGNNITNNAYGIYLEYSGNDISGNNITNNTVGLMLLTSSDNIILENNITNNGISGIRFAGSSKNAIYGNNIINNDRDGIHLYKSSNNIIYVNNITNNWSYQQCGIYLDESPHNSVYGNTIANNWYGIQLRWSSDILIFLNNFVNNYEQVYSENSVNDWDDGYPSGGNYWSDYTGVDLFSGPYQNETGSDGLGDSPYVIDENNQDNYPLMGPFSSFDAGVWGGVAYTIDIISNSTISDFHFNPKEGSYLKFNVTGSDGTVGFCRVTIPKQLLWAKENEWDVTVNGNQVNYSAFLDENNTYLYFTYQHSTKTVTITGTSVITLYTLNITSTDGGTTYPSPGTYLHVNGTAVSVLAIPENGYSFDYWLLDGEVKTENPITITMDSNHTLEAYFVDDIKPNISDPWQDPPSNNVQPYQNVTVWVNVTDYGSGIKNVTLWYSLNNGTTWEPPVNMTALPIPSDATVTYMATIPGYENCTWITYKIIAYDKAGNNATKNNSGYYYKYHVIPEFPTTTMLTLLMLTTLTATILLNKKRKPKLNKFLNFHVPPNMRIKVKFPIDDTPNYIPN